jgi:hypothetical protein
VAGGVQEQGGVFATDLPTQAVSHHVAEIHAERVARGSCVSRPIRGVASLQASHELPLLVRSGRAADRDSGAHIVGESERGERGPSPRRIPGMPAGPAPCYWARSGSIVAAGTMLAFTTARNSLSLLSRLLSFRSRAVLRCEPIS